MSKEDKPDNPPAFPLQAYAMDAHRWSYGQEGMTLRDYFAGQAAQPLLMDLLKQEQELSLEQASRRIALAAYGYADAMLKERGRDE